MDFGISINVAHGQVDALNGVMSRFVSEVGMSQAEATQRGTIAFIKSVRARTLKAPKKRHVISIDKKGRTVPDKGIFAGKKCRLYMVYTYPRGEKKKKYFFAPNISQARNTVYAKITRWGLARLSWGWFMKKLFNRSAGAENKDLKMDDSAVRCSKSADYRKNLYTVHMENSLSYIERASPDSVVADSLEKARKFMLYRLEQEIEKKKAKEMLA